MVMIYLPHRSHSFRSRWPSEYDEYLTHVWKLDETSGNREDSIGSLDLSPTNAPTYTTGKSGNCINLESSLDQYLRSASGFTSGATIICTSLWVKFESVGNYQMLLWDDTSNSSWDHRYYLMCYNTNRLYVYMKDSGGAFTGASSTNTFSAGSWYHILAVTNTTTNKINAWVNGESWIDASVTMAAFDNTTSKHGTHLGIAKTESGILQWATDGLIDEVYTWGEIALGEKQAKALYNNGKGCFWTAA